MNVYPVIFDPIYKPKIWGGQRLFTYWERTPTISEPVGESWEMADLESDQSRVVNGLMRGKSITELMAAWGADLMGRAELFEGRFPLLIKFLDAAESLSVQVHPSEAMARRLGGNVRVKHEAWYILAADPGSFIYHGLEPGVDANTFRDAMLTGRVDGILRKINVRPGDCYYLPSGTVHALGAGVLVAEVQTPSDITYRTYDWGRIDASTGQPRALHLDQAIECIDFGTPSPSPMQKRSHMAVGAMTVTQLVNCPSFIIERVRMNEGARRDMPYTEPVVWIVLEGRGQLNWQGGGPLEFHKGNVLLLPAGLQGGSLSISESAQWLEVSVPVPSDLVGFERPPREQQAPSGGQPFVSLGMPRTDS